MGGLYGRVRLADRRHDCSEDNAARDRSNVRVIGSG